MAITSSACAYLFGLVLNFPYKMHMLMFSWEPALGVYAVSGISYEWGRLGLQMQKIILL